MRRALVPGLVLVAGVVLLVAYLVVNPSIDALAAFLLDYLILLAAAAGIAGGVEVAWAQAERLISRRGDRIAAAVTLAGFLAVVAVGFFPGSRGADEPAMRWIVASLLIPLVTALFSLLFFFMLAAVWRGLRLRGRETTVIVGAAALMVLLLLPLGGNVGRSLAAGAGWALDVPVGAIFRGFLIGVAIATAVAAGRMLLTAGADE